MKLSCSLCLVFVLFAYVTLALSPPSINFLEVIRNRPLQWEFTLTNSTCGNMNCTNDSDECPNFPFIQSNCVNGFCEYNPIADPNVCTNPTQCGSHYCDCPSPILSDGCKCASNNSCNSYACYSGVCQNDYGYIGEFCNSNADCDVGRCNKNNLCELVTEGGGCDGDSDCEVTLYCDVGNTTCVERPTCNETTDDTVGYCPDYGLCYEGTCFPMYAGALGDGCVTAANCQPGLACLNATGTVSTCQRVPFGSSCESDDDCEFFTQECLCAEPDDSAFMECIDPGTRMCKDEAIDLANCLITENCILYDINDMSSDCGKKCNALQNILTCCQICLYPEYSDNAYPNVAGFCANDTMTSINCCSDTVPCSIVTTDQLCLGYSEMKRKK